MLRDGNFYLTKNVIDSEYGIDPACRCGRHDRHLLPPGERNVPYVVPNDTAYLQFID